MWGTYCITILRTPGTRFSIGSVRVKVQVDDTLVAHASSGALSVGESGDRGSRRSAEWGEVGARAHNTGHCVVVEYTPTPRKDTGARAIDTADDPAGGVPSGSNANESGAYHVVGAALGLSRSSK